MKKISLCLLSLSLFLISCTDEIDGLTFEKVSPVVSAPIGTVTLSTENLSDLFDSLSLREGPSNVIEFYYDTDFINLPVFDRFSLKNQQFANRIPFTSVGFTNGEMNISSPEEYNSFTIANKDLSDPAAELTKVNFKGGTISISQDKNFDHDLNTNVSFPKLTKNGVALSISLNNIEAITESLTDYKLDLTGSNGDTVNTIEYALNSTIIETGNSDTGSFTLSFALENMEFTYLEGDLKTYRFDDFDGQFDLGLPQNDFPDNIRFTDPKIELTAMNSSGIPFGFNFNGISVIEENGDTSLITGTYLEESQILNASNTPGQSAESIFMVSNENTNNLVDFISNIPESVYFNGFIEANPDTTVKANNYVTDSSGLSVSAQLILPMTGYVNNYAVTDTINNVNLSLSDDGSVSLENINFRVVSENAFPINIAVQLYFMDSTETAGNIVLDSLFDSFEASVISPAGEVNGEGIVNSATTLLSDISIDQEKYERIKTSSKIKLVGKLLSPGANDANPKSVKVTTDNYLTISLGLSAQAIIDPAKF
ncbi:hypothetical protein [Marivirga sp.]|uniref:hypothetical protein n=1 Tax=Marivirga sp. TaxID=2018662 RepID=UPI0025D9507F|nr:hypothetical protein [Marivirga sp.]